MLSEKKQNRMRRKKRALRVRKRARGTRQQPRMCVQRTNQHIGAQLIDDENSITLASASTLHKDFKGTDFAKKNKQAAAKVGLTIAEQAKKLGIERVVFDRGPYKYHGLVATIADAARESGLKL